MFIHIDWYDIDIDADLIASPLLMLSEVLLFAFQAQEEETPC